MGEKVSGVVVWVSGFEAVGFVVGECLDSGIGFEMEFYPELFSFGVDPFKSVRGISVHVSVCFRCSSVGEEDGGLVAGFGGPG